jgi:DNA-binding NarL/FixJ family response regulator
MDREPIRILVVDDHAAIRESLRLVLADEPTVRIVGEGKSADDALELAGRLRPDVVLMDLMMPGTDSLEAVRTLRGSCPGVQVLVFTSFAEQRNVDAALEAGAIGFLLKDVPADKLVLALADARDGRPSFYLGPAAGGASQSWCKSGRPSA